MMTGIRREVFLMTLLFVGTAQLPAQNPDVLSLDGRWEMHQKDIQQWHEASVPGCVHLDLLADGSIPDPFYRMNEMDLQWIGEKDWEYRRTFSVNDDFLSRDNVELVLEGVDTYADVYINDYLVCSCDNMFRTWRTDVKGYLKKGENTVDVVFTSVFKEDMPKYLAAPFKLMACQNNDQADIWLSVYARKAGYEYGWDWGPRLITSGLWKPVKIEAWDNVRLETMRVRTLDISDLKKVRMCASAEVRSDKECDAVVKVFCNGSQVAATTGHLTKGVSVISCDFRMKNPELWWCSNLGSSPLYDFHVEVETPYGKVSGNCRTGVRTITVKREDDSYGKSFTVCLNGRNVFCKGANMIPLDNFLPRVTKKDYINVVKNAVDANMNMLRVWGGGIYESDDFYDVCDSLGVLVWQDMTFACNMPPYDSYYASSVEAEVRDNVKRLRNHPSLALWCGNNENEVAYYKWGWKELLTPDQRAVYEKGFNRLFHEIIPSVVEEEDGTRFYNESSPCSGYSGRAHSTGDVHFWSVWKGGWLEEYLDPGNIGRFMSEYGFQALPCEKTIESFTIESDRHLDSPVMLSHQKAHDDVTRDPNFGNKMMKMYMAKYFKVPDDFHDFVYMSQVQQAEAVKIAIEAHRRAKPYCMGTMYWQINDCWPVSSWSSVDYSGEWKALHYYVRRLYAEVLPSFYRTDEGSVSVKLISELPTGLPANVSVCAMDASGQMLLEKSVDVKLAADGVSDVMSFSAEELSSLPSSLVFHAMVTGKDGKNISDNVWFSEYSNTYSYRVPELDFKTTALPDGFELTVSSDVPVRALHLVADGVDAALGDDYFTVLPGFPVSLKVTTAASAEEFLSALKCISVNSTQN